MELQAWRENWASIYLSLQFSVPGTFYFALFSSLGISAIIILGYLIELVRSAALAVEAGGIWSILDFNKQPSVAAAVVVITVFTIIYWPVVLGIDLIPS
jgi:hypothetical protein